VSDAKKNCPLGLKQQLRYGTQITLEVELFQLAGVQIALDFPG
jgi:hypothetical protein